MLNDISTRRQVFLDTFRSAIIFGDMEFAPKRIRQKYSARTVRTNPGLNWVLNKLKHICGAMQKTVLM